MLKDVRRRQERRFISKNPTLSGISSPTKKFSSYFFRRSSMVSIRFYLSNSLFNVLTWKPHSLDLFLRRFNVSIFSLGFIETIGTPVFHVIPEGLYRIIKRFTE